MSHMRELPLIVWGFQNHFGFWIFRTNKDDIDLMAPFLSRNKSYREYDIFEAFSIRNQHREERNDSPMTFEEFLEEVEKEESHEERLRMIESERKGKEERRKKWEEWKQAREKIAEARAKQDEITKRKWEEWQKRRERDMQKLEEVYEKSRQELSEKSSKVK